MDINEAKAYLADCHRSPGSTDETGTDASIMWWHGDQAVGCGILWSDSGTVTVHDTTFTGDEARELFNLGIRIPHPESLED